MKLVCGLILLFSFRVLAGVPSSDRAQELCSALLAPHRTFSEILPSVSDEDALIILKSNYSELLTWLSQKADATAEGASSHPKGNLGPEKELTPSALLFGSEITEVNRTAVGFLALKWILANDYGAFTRNQAEPIRLSLSSFEKLRAYVLSVLKTPEDVDAMIVMILTNDLGKVKRYHELTEKGVGRLIVDHDEVLFIGFSDWPEISPNFLRLGSKHKTWIVDGLKMGSDLNIGQFAQAENLPANLRGVKILRGKSEAFDFKFIELLLDVAGASGHLDSNGAKVMIEPVFQNFMLAREALLEVIEGKSLRAAYDQVLVAKSKFLVGKGFMHLGVENSEERALLRLMTLRRSTNAEQAEELFEVFNDLPDDVQMILTAELNVDAVGDGWGILPYYAPAFINNALSGLKDGTSSDARERLRSVFIALAQVFNLARAELHGRSGDGVLTVNLEALAKFALSPDFQSNPHSLLEQKFELYSNADDANQFGVRLTPPRSM